MINSFAIMIFGVWLIAGITSSIIKNVEPMNCALIFSVISGFGYLISTGH